LVNRRGALIAYNPSMVAQIVPQAPPLKTRTQISMRAIRALIKLIVQKFHPEQIIFFWVLRLWQTNSMERCGFVGSDRNPSWELDSVSHLRNGQKIREFVRL